jgi:peroxiredoxin
MRWLQNILRGRGPSMTALATGKKAPDIQLKTAGGKPFSLTEALARGPVALAFFKVSCPVCQYAFPYLERLHQAYRQNGYTLVGVSQNEAKDTAAFNKEFGVTFPVLLDELDRYPVSNAYGLTNVPMLFWIARDGEIEISSVGWQKADFEALNRKMADAGKTSAAPLFKPGESVPDFRAG